ncbi:uncharacterized protein LOC112341732 [Selaginella moellendorffii]|uniref:uncharacterized protein LOC112341732 n=1 Tax=Selaginella moellendorffii TaxID=88036 RepID=UPI000D1D0260|nr:uncharacterized protein LOC112341732 [Selaginella moellendorffii]|eukprot:XP_024518105.1 uncharacterized protein LOC112341732 [Selaginella moellendorffii]
MSRQPLVEVELFIDGKGPEHVFKAPLGGWDQNRLDLEQIMIDYKLRAIYAYSLSSGRGQRLRYNPRNGLSMLPYSGKSDSIIRLDGDPKVRKFSILFFRKFYLEWISMILQRSRLVPVIKIGVGIGFIVAMVTCIFVDFSSDWIQALRNASAGRMMLVVCFVTMIILQISRQARSHKKRL